MGIKLRIVPYLRRIYNAVAVPNLRPQIHRISLERDKTMSYTARAAGDIVRIKPSTQLDVSECLTKNNGKNNDMNLVL